jgi:hypothetical protein
MEMNRLPIDNGFALLKFGQELPSKDRILGCFLPAISRSRQNFYGIAGFSGKGNFPATTKILPKKILTSQNSQTVHEMPYLDQKGRGENAGH